MKSKRKREAPGRARDVLAAHLRRYMDERYKYAGTLTKQTREFARDSGVSFTAIQRAASPEVYNSGANIDTVERLARAMQVETYELLRAPPDEDAN